MGRAVDSTPTYGGQAHAHPTPKIGTASKQAYLAAQVSEVDEHCDHAAFNFVLVCTRCPTPSQLSQANAHRKHTT